MTIEEAFATALREIRVESGLTQEKLAFDAGLDRTYISLLERGKRQPGLSVLFQLAAALGVQPRYLVERVEELASES